VNRQAGGRRAGPHGSAQVVAGGRRRKEGELREGIDRVFGFDFDFDIDFVGWVGSELDRATC
jgi:hypothetical protein